MDELTRLRDELTALDRDILALARRRQELVRAVGVYKSKADRPIFDRRRERKVLERAERTAADLGLAPELGRRLLGLLIEASHDEQHSEVAARAAETHSFCLVGGGGGMGRLLHRELTRRGHAVTVLEREDGQDRRAVVSAAEIVVVCVPMAQASTVTREVAAWTREHALLCDINSLKEEIAGVLTECAPGEALGLHPMFGPTVSSLRRQKVVVCPLRDGPLSRWLVSELGQLGVDLIETDPATHDRMMAVVQVLVHFSTLVMGTALSRSGVSVQDSLRFTSPIYRLELAFTSRLFAQDPGLYAAIEMDNPVGPEVRAAFLEAARELIALIDAGDRAGFEAHFSALSSFFAGFADEGMALSDFLIDALVGRP